MLAQHFSLFFLPTWAKTFSYMFTSVMELAKATHSTVTAQEKNEKQWCTPSKVLPKYMKTHLFQRLYPWWKAKMKKTRHYNTCPFSRGSSYYFRSLFLFLLLCQIVMNLCLYHVESESSIIQWNPMHLCINIDGSCEITRLHGHSLITQLDRRVCTRNSDTNPRKGYLH